MKITPQAAMMIAILYCLISSIIILFHCDAKYQPKKKTDYQINVTQKDYTLMDGSRVVHIFHWGDNPKLEETIDIDNQ